MRHTVLALVGVVLLAGSTTARAHHSYAGFTDSIVAVEGTLEKVMFANPHVAMVQERRRTWTHDTPACNTL